MGAVSGRLDRTAGDARRAHGAARVGSWALAAISTGCLVAAGVLAITWGTTLELTGPSGVLAVLLAVALVGSFAVVGLLLTLRVPSNPIGWLFAIIGVQVSLVVLGATIGDSPRPDTVRVWGAWIGSWTGGSIVPLLALVALLFPDGHPLNRRWSILTRALVAFSIAFPIASAFVPGEIDGSNGLANPVGIEAFDADLLGVFWLAIPVFVVAAGVSLVIRFRRADGLERKQIELLALAAVLLAIANVLTAFTYGTRLEDPAIIVSIVTVVLVPVFAGIAILRHRLYDIEVVIRKTVLYTLLAGMILLLALAVLLVIGGSLVGLGWASAAAFVLGILVWPLRRVATRIADRIVYGGRATPYEALTAFTGTMGAIGPDAVLSEMAEAVGRATGAERSWLWLRDGGGARLAASWPADAPPPGGFADAERFSITHQGDELGAVTVSMPAADPMNDSKRLLIGDLAANAGPVLRNVLLVDDLRESRRRIVAAQDERAKALERNIHDGAQQQLVALAVKQRLTASLVGKDDARAAAMLEELQADTTDALENLRALARGIYPPLLADQGLAAAIEAHARRSTLPVTVSANGLARYGQDVESAVYFTVLEALQNVAKYAEASAVAVELDGDEHEVAFTVTDDGRGFDAGSTPRGSGVQGMTDRIAAVGGSVEIRSRPGEGTAVRGHVPA